MKEGSALIKASLLHCFLVEGICCISAHAVRTNCAPAAHVVRTKYEMFCSKERLRRKMITIKQI